MSVQVVDVFASATPLERCIVVFVTATWDTRSVLGNNTTITALLIFQRVRQFSLAATMGRGVVT